MIQAKRHLAGRFKSVIDKDDSSYFARVALPARSHRLGCPNLVYMAYFPALSLLSATDSAYSWLIPCLLLPYFWTLAFCSIFCLFLPYSWLIPALFLAYSCLISGLFLPYFCLIFGFWLSAAYSAYSCLIPGLFLPYSWLIPALFLAYSCLISALFFDFGFLQHILLIPALFLAYSCLISALFLDFGFLQHILLIPALFLAYSCLISALFLDFGFLQHLTKYIHSQSFSFSVGPKAMAYCQFVGSCFVFWTTAILIGFLFGLPCCLHWKIIGYSSIIFPKSTCPKEGSGSEAS